MTTLDVPCDGRATFHRLGVRELRDMLLAAEKHRPTRVGEMDTPPFFASETVRTYLRPIAYLARGIGT